MWLEVFLEEPQALLLSANPTFSRKREIAPESEHPFLEVRYLYIDKRYLYAFPPQQRANAKFMPGTPMATSVPHSQHQRPHSQLQFLVPKGRSDEGTCPGDSPEAWWHPGDTQSLTYAALSTSPARIVGVRKILRPPFAPGGGKRARAGDSHLAGQETGLQTRREKSPSMELRWKMTRWERTELL